MLKFANVTLEILLEFGIRYPCQSLAIIEYEKKNCFCLATYYI
jgi:hypothetical protein